MARLLSGLFVLFALASATGCGSNPPGEVAAPQPVPEGGSAFQPEACGEIIGRVTWAGTPPDVPPISAIVPAKDGSGHATQLLTPPNAPHIDRTTYALEGAVIFLRGVDPARARPWDLPPVSVEYRNLQIVVKQGERTGRTGFVRRGGTVTASSAEPRFHVLRGRGAAFFALPFPESNKPLTRTLDTIGRVELTDAAGYYWQAAEVFVCEHPYYAVTDIAGRFRFERVPAGTYELVAWQPNWVVTETERNPETTLPSRLIYAPPLETTRALTVDAGHTELANLTLPK